MKAEELAVIKERAQSVISDGWYYDGSTVRQTHCIPVIWSDGDGPRMNDEIGQFIAHAREDIPKLVAEVERLQSQEHFAEYAIRQNKALWEALSKACASLGADTLDYYEEEGGV